MQAIELRNASYRYEGSEKYALKNINLKINKGEILAIAGKNGSGKTTLAKLILGLLEPVSGEVYVNGKKPEPGRSKIGLVFQNPLHQLFCESVSEEIAFGLKNLTKMEMEQRINALLREHALFDHRDKHPLALSEGERKALALASVLAMDPDFLILDEPTLGQDLLHQQRLIALLRTLAKNGKGIIIISHDLEFISEIAQRVILMLDGEILADSTSEEILFDEELLERCGLTMPVIPKLVKLLSLNPTLSEDEILLQLIKMREGV